MATIAELRAALEAERSIATQLAEKSLDAVDKISNTGNFWLAAFGLTLGILALVGFAVVLVGARKMAKTIAESRINSYLDSEEGKKYVRACIRAEVNAQMETRIFTHIPPAAPDPVEGSFAKAPEQKGGLDAT